MQGQAANLGGGVFKNDWTTIATDQSFSLRVIGIRYVIIYRQTRPGQYWRGRLAALRVLAKNYAELTERQNSELVEQTYFVEMRNDDETKK